MSGTIEINERDRRMAELLAPYGADLVPTQTRKIWRFRLWNGAEITIDQQPWSSSEPTYLCIARGDMRQTWETSIVRLPFEMVEEWVDLMSSGADDMADADLYERQRRWDPAGKFSEMLPS